MTTKTPSATAAEIREHLGHGLGDRRVTVHRDGAVTYTGTTEADARSTALVDNFVGQWLRLRNLGVYAGHIDDLAREIRREKELDERRRAARRAQGDALEV